MKTTKKRIKLVIDRKRWGRRSLYNAETDKYCSLGFLAIKCGLSKKYIKDHSIPSFVELDHEKRGSKNVAKWPLKLFTKTGIDSKLCLDIIQANDKMERGSEREERLISLFDKMNVELSFKGKHK